MNIEKIYIVVIHQVDHFEELELSTKPFLSIDKAKEYFNSIIKDERNHANKEGWEIETDTDTCFCAFEYGKYSENHSFVELREEEISKAGYNQYCNSESICFNLMCDSFKQGAKWADEHPNLSSLWHDASEEPQIGFNIVFVDKYGHWWDIQPYNDDNYDWDGLKGWVCCVYINHIQKWAYIDDILPKGGEE